jgi:predicted acetyltransferase
MRAELVEATEQDREIIQNLARFYVYDMSRFCGFLPDWEVLANGLYECIDLGVYWKEPGHYPFLIKMGSELAGFALINKVTNTPGVEWNMGQFFILAKFQKKGMGRYIAEELFERFPGVWQVMQIPENEAAIAFWERVIDRYTGGEFERSQREVPHPKPHPMNVFTFRSGNVRPAKEEYTFCYKEQASLEEEAVLVDGIIQEAASAKGMERMTPFAFFIKNNERQIVAGVKGLTYYGCLYTDSLWVTASLRKQGFGTLLMRKVEELARERGCTFALVASMDWEAPLFYERLGYRVEVVREGYAKNSKMFVLRKELAS